jgi:aminoglycoside phosphotransferase (APT) family kinase protein
MNLADQLKAFIAEQLAGAEDLAIANLARMSGGASRETWTFDVSWRENGRTVERGCVLRRDPVLSLLEAGLTTDRSFEFRTVKALEDLPLPLPRMYWLDAEGKALGRPSLIMERMAGQPSPPAFPPGMDAAFREKIAGQFIEILRQVHSLDWRARGLDFLGVPGPGRDAALRQARLWKDVYDRRRPEPLPVIAAALGWLEAHAPETDRITLVHGDFRTGNFLFEDPGLITAMLDWELAHLGDPMEDVGWASMKFWSGSGLVGGLIEPEDFFRRYEQVAGIPVDRDRVFFYQVLGNVKMAVIALSGVRAFAEGADLLLGLVGFLVPRLCEDIADQLGL